MVVIDAYCSEPGYAAHLWPILDALPDDIRGDLYVPSNHRREHDRPVRLGHAPSSEHPLLVAGYQDLVYARRSKVLVQHGAGQVYNDVENGSYAGGPGHEQADLFLCPNEVTCALERARYARARCVAVGCPKIDAWQQIPRPQNDPPVIAVTFHWNCTVARESGWAWPTWRDTIEVLAKTARVLGHCHPRARQQLVPWWNAIGVEYVPAAEDLVARSDVLCVDNSSIAYEAAACDMPVVFIADRTWNPHAQHGLRFGDPLPGPDLGACGDDPVVQAAALRDVCVDQLANTVNARFWRSRRHDVARRVYGPIDGHASERAAAAVLDLIDHPAGNQTYREARPCKTC